MFIAHFKDGKTITENQMVWNEVPDGISNLQLTLPVSFKIKDSQTGEIKDAPAPAVTLGKYDSYYFENEAVATILTSSSGKIEAIESTGVKVAQIIGGIDEIKGIVVEIRVDKFCNIEVHRFPLEKLESTRVVKKSVKVE